MLYIYTVYIPIYKYTFPVTCLVIPLHSFSKMPLNKKHGQSLVVHLVQVPNFKVGERASINAATPKWMVDNTQNDEILKG
jgi:hypothetical protein